VRRLRVLLAIAAAAQRCKASPSLRDCVRADPLDHDAANLFRTNRKEHDKRAKEVGALASAALAGACVVRGRGVAGDDTVRKVTALNT
jgi:hypothetical protein